MTTKPESQYAYGNEVIRCHACAAQQREVKKFVADGGDESGILVRMTRSPDE